MTITGRLSEFSSDASFPEERPISHERQRTIRIGPIERYYGFRYDVSVTHVKIGLRSMPTQMSCFTP